MQAPRSLTSRDKRLDAVNLGCVSSEVQVMHLLAINRWQLGYSIKSIYGDHFASKSLPI